MAEHSSEAAKGFFIHLMHCDDVICWLLNVQGDRLIVSQGRICLDNNTFCHTEIECTDSAYFTRRQRVQQRADQS